MKDKLYGLLDTIGYPVYEQGSLSDTKDYDDHFFTVWNTETPEDNHYDNKPHMFIWTFQIDFYSIDPRLTNSILLKARDLLIENNWIVQGKGNDILSDSKHHSGRTITAKYIEKEI